MINTWIEKYYTTEDDWGVINHHYYICPKCEIKVKEKSNYCPNCGAKKQEVEENEKT